jgi:arginine-tRNA-protein transferase
VYLGYWVPESRKMAYKARFRPSEILAGGSWRMLTDADLNDPGRTGTLLVPETADLG